MDKAGTFEYEIRKDFRNNQIVREVDERRLRDLWQSLGIGVVLVVVAGSAIIGSIVNGLSLMVQSRSLGRWENRAIYRLLAWNLLEPGITVPWILVNIFILRNTPQISRAPDRD